MSFCRSVNEDDEIILSISEIDEINYAGYEIKTNRQTIVHKMESINLCCENWDIKLLDKDGNIVDTEDYIDSTIYSVGFDLTTTGVENNEIIVNVDTSKGLLRICARNDHNGYYQHNVITSWLNVNVENSL